MKRNSWRMLADDSSDSPAVPKNAARGGMNMEHPSILVENLNRSSCLRCALLFSFRRNK